MRGDPARTVRGRLIQREVAEYILTKDAGLTRRDIHGVERRGRHVERRHDIAATTRRTLGRVGRRRFAMGVATFGTVVGVTAALAGLESVGVYVGGLVWFVAFLIDRYAPDVVFDGDVAPKAIVVEEHEPGMSGDEYARRLAIHSKRNEVKEEKIEKRRKEHERKAKSNRRTF